MTSPRAPIVKHAVTTVRTVEAAGDSRQRRHVFCSRRKESVALATCTHCPRFLGVSESEHEQTVRCTAADGSGEQPLETTPLALPRLTVASIMTRNVVCVRPDLTLDAATALFLESGLKSVPVVDVQGKLIGFVSESDVMLEVQSGASSPKTVGDVMMPYALTLPETAAVTRAAALMAFEGQQRLAIVSREGEVVGVLSASDILYFLARSDGYALPRPRTR